MCFVSSPVPGHVFQERESGRNITQAEACATESTIGYTRVAEKVALTPSFYGIYDAIRILRKYSSLLIHRVERGPNGPGRPRGIYTPIIQLLQTDFHEKHSLAFDFI
jgi:hypothetical protein